MKKKNHNNKWKRLRAKRDDTDITKQYTPSDYQHLVKDKGNGSGIMRLGTGDLHLPSSLDTIGEGQQTNSPPKIVLVIVTLALIFISIITYFVMQMPPKD